MGMMNDLPYWLAGAVALGFLIHGSTDWFTPAARLRRKRERNHRRLLSRSGRPSVMLNVRTRKDRERSK